MDGRMDGIKVGKGMKLDKGQASQRNASNAPENDLVFLFYFSN